MWYNWFASLALSASIISRVAEILFVSTQQWLMQSLKNIVLFMSEKNLSGKKFSLAENAATA